MKRYKVTARFEATGTVVSDVFGTYGEAVACVNAFAGQYVNLTETNARQGALAEFRGTDWDSLFCTGTIVVSA